MSTTTPITLITGGSRGLSRNATLRSLQMAAISC